MLSEEMRQVEAGKVFAYDGHVRCVSEGFFEHGHHVAVEFDCHDFGPSGSKFHGERADAGTDFKDTVAFMDIERIEDFVQHITVDKKVYSAVKRSEVSGIIAEYSKK